MIDSVAGMMNAPPMPMNARVAIRTFGDPATADSSEPSPNNDEAELQRRAAAEAVAERSRGEQQAREHEGVRVDHPLQLRVRGIEFAHDRRATPR